VAIWPSTPSGFKVELYGAGLDNPRTLRAAPSGNIFLAETDPGRIRVFRGLALTTRTGWFPILAETDEH
jgi:glucose/arabinose dehydrogenase